MAYWCHLKFELFWLLRNSHTFHPTFQGHKSWIWTWAPALTTWALWTSHLACPSLGFFIYIIKWREPDFLTSQGYKNQIKQCGNMFEKSTDVHKNAWYKISEFPHFTKRKKCSDVEPEWLIHSCWVASHIFKPNKSPGTFLSKVPS